jgi:hypothetical protein
VILDTTLSIRPIQIPSRSRVSGKGAIDRDRSHSGRMDMTRIREVAPHYVAMVLLAILVFRLIEAVAGPVNFWGEIVIIAVVVFSYRPAVMALGYGPSAWERESENL